MAIEFVHDLYAGGFMWLAGCRLTAEQERHFGRPLLNTWLRAGHIVEHLDQFPLAEGQPQARMGLSEYQAAKAAEAEKAKAAKVASVDAAGGASVPAPEPTAEARPRPKGAKGERIAATG